MNKEADRFDRELGALLLLHRTAKGLSREDLARRIGLKSTQIERYEAGTNRLSVRRYWTIMKVLGQDPCDVFEPLHQRLSLPDTLAGDGGARGLSFMSSNRGRQIVNALANCERPDVLNALGDLILTIGTRLRSPTAFTTERSTISDPDTGDLR